MLNRERQHPQNESTKFDSVVFSAKKKAPQGQKATLYLPRDRLFKIALLMMLYSKRQGITKETIYLQ